VVDEQVRFLVFVDVNFQVTVIVVSGGCHDDGVGLAYGEVFFLLFAVGESLRVVVTIVLFVFIVSLHLFVIAVLLAKRFSLHFGKLSSEDGDVIFFTTIIVNGHVL
jgi:hypothetical protein